MTSSREVRYLDDYLAWRPAEPGRHAARRTRLRSHSAPPREQKSTFAAVLHFDEFSDKRVRQAWAVLDRSGVPSAGSTYDDGYRPHVTLAIVDSTTPEKVARRIRGPLADVAGMSLTMTSLGFFLTDRAPAYLAVAPTRHLLEVHDAVHAALGGEESWPYYQPGSWMPHCTLAMDVECQTTVAGALSSTTLPIQATVGSAHLVELPPWSAKPNRRQPGAHRRVTGGRRVATQFQRLRG